MITPADEGVLSPRAAVALQRDLASRVVRRTRSRAIRYVAGADVAVLPERQLALASVVVLTFPDLEVVGSVDGSAPLDFPYIPGLLSFREMPAVLSAFARLAVRPDVLLCDAHGVAHPRGFGLASHLGVVLDLPTIGCAKSRLFGTHGAPAEAKGSSVPLTHPRDGSVLGAVVRTRTGVRPIYVSIGHLVDLPFAVRTVLRCARRFRLPEPTRLAHLAVTAARRAAGGAAAP